MKTNKVKVRFITSVFACIMLASSASAACIGSTNFYSCYDSSGNSYSINKLGGTTMMTGRNARTGSSWNQTTTTFGNHSYTTGRASNGNSWTLNTTPYGTYGRDSNGNSFNSLLLWD